MFWNRGRFDTFFLGFENLTKKFLGPMVVHSCRLAALWGTGMNSTPLYSMFGAVNPCVVLGHVARNQQMRISKKKYHMCLRVYTPSVHLVNYIMLIWLVNMPYITCYHAFSFLICVLFLTVYLVRYVSRMLMLFAVYLHEFWPYMYIIHRNRA